jgi:hypothetical protein
MGLKSRLFVAAGVVVGGIGLMTPAASAGEPAVTGCYGESISLLASNQPVPGAFGQAVVSFAQAPDAQPGLGEGVQALQAGLVPDEVVPNTCNG